MTDKLSTDKSKTGQSLTEPPQDEIDTVSSQIGIYACMGWAADAFDVDETLLRAIAKTEGGKIGTASENSNGTHDLGIMQINTIWVPQLAKTYGLSQLDMTKRLQNKPCFNITVAAWILKGRIEAAGDIWTGVGHYHSKTPKYRDRYIRRVMRHYNQF